jgi:hypothetical protein
MLPGARRRRSGGGPGEGCARRPVGTYLYLHAVGVGNPMAWHGRGLNEVPTAAIRGIGSCREAMYGGFWKKHNIRTPAHGTPARPVRYVFSATKYSHVLSRPDGNNACKMFFGEERYGRVNGGTRVLEMAAESWEATLGHGAR